MDTKKCILPLSVSVIAGFKVKFLFCSFLTHTLFSTADQTQHPPSVPNEGGRFSLHAVIGPVESFNGITQRNGLLNTICWSVLLLFLVLLTLSFSFSLSLFHSWVQGAVGFAGTQRPCNYSLSCLFLFGGAVSNSDNLYYRIHSMHGWAVSWVCTNREGTKK